MLIILIILYITSRILIYLITGSLYLFTTFIQFLLPPSPNSAAAAKSLQSCLTLCDPIDGSPPGSPVPGILQTRTLEWVAIAFSIVWKWKVKSENEVAQSCPILVTPWTAAYQAPPSMGFSRQEYWSEMPLPSLSPNSGNYKFDLFFYEFSCCLFLKYNLPLLVPGVQHMIWYSIHFKINTTSLIPICPTCHYTKIVNGLFNHGIRVGWRRR